MEKDKEYWDKEYIKCKEDPVYFYNNYVVIKGQNTRTITHEQFNNIRKMANSPLKYIRRR